MIKKLIDFLFINVFISKHKKFLLRPNIFTFKSYSSDDKLLFDKEWIIDIDWLFFNLTITNE